MNEITVIPDQLSYNCIPRGTKTTYSNTNNFTFQPLCWDHQDVGEISRSGRYNSDDRVFTVFISGATDNGNSVTVSVPFEPYFLIKLGDGPLWKEKDIDDFVHNFILFSDGKYNERTDTWEYKKRTYRYVPEIAEEENKSKDDLAKEKTDGAMHLTYESTFAGWEVVMLKDLDAGFTGLKPKEFQYLKLKFKTFCGMKACSFALNNDYMKQHLTKSNNKTISRTKISIYEANLEPHIRLMHLTKCEPSGWISIRADKYTFVAISNQKGSSSKIEIRLDDWHNMFPAHLDAIAQFRECSFDIETYSNDDGKFPMACIRDNVILQIASTFEDFGTGKPPVCVLYNLHGCEPMRDADVLKCFDTEREMLLAWSQLIRNSDSETVHAYNGWEFDYGYIIERAKMLNCWDEFRYGLGRIKSIPSRHVEQSLSSKAYGDNHWVLLTMSGRVVFDPIVHLQREYKLKSYMLKATSEYFLSVKLPKNPLKAEAGSKLVRVNHPNHGLTEAKVIHFSDIDTPDIERSADGKRYYAWAGWNYEELNENLHIVKEVISKDEYVIEMERVAVKSSQGGGGTVKAFETKHDVSFPVMNQAYRDNNAKIMHDVGRYCLSEDSQILTNKGFLFLDQILNENNHELLICGYDPTTKEHVYERASEIIVNKKQKQEMIEFTNHNESLRWGEGSDAYGRYHNSDDRDGYSNNVSLIVTPEHDMYAQFGRYRSSSNPKKSDFFEKRRSSDFAKRKASTLLSDDQKDGVQFLAFAENGIRIDHDDTALPFIDILDLKSTEQVHAFLALYGYWLGDGCLIFDNPNYRWHKESVSFNPVKKQDVTYLFNLFSILGLVSNVDYVHVLPTEKHIQHIIEIRAERYTMYFRSQYQENYKSHDTCATYVESDIDRQVPEEGPKTAKWLWSWCWNLSKEQCRHLIAGLRFADGSETAKRNVIFMSSVRFRDEIVRLCLHAGYSVRFKSMYLKGESRGIDKRSGKEIVATKDAWTVEYAVKNVIRPALKARRDIKKITYTGRTWCVTVPHGFIVTRRAHLVDGVITKASRPTIQGNCIQDTLLPQKILDKLCVLPNLIEMSKVTWVPLEYLITRGQQIKVFSQICKAAHEAGYAVPTIAKPKIDPDAPETDVVGEDEGYVGGAVLDPVVGFYDTPISVPDFKSLYPSTMIDNNLCLSSLVKDPKYDNLPGVDYNRIKVGNKIHVFAMNNDGIVPGILAYLLTTRDKRKEMMANAKTDIEKMIHNGAQLALKVSANSIYGFMGIPPEMAVLPCMAIAESTTARGREGTFATRDYMQATDNFRDIMKYDANVDGMPLNWFYLIKNVAKNKCFHLTGEKLLKAFGFQMSDLADGQLHATHGSTSDLRVWTSNTFEQITGFSLTDVDGQAVSGVSNPISNNKIKLLRVHTMSGLFYDMRKYNCKIVYGDSVTADTPILIKLGNTLNYVNIEDIPRKTDWMPYLETKEYAEPVDGMEVWSDKKFTPLRRIIRHVTNKDIYRVLTHTGSVCVTSDHSLLSDKGVEVRPVDVKIKDRLLHAELPQPETFVVEGDPLLGCPYAMGLFYGDGSCGKYGEKEKTKYSWAINNLNKDFLNRAKLELEAHYPEMKFNILETVESSGVYKLVPNAQNKAGETKRYGVRDITKEWRTLFYTSRKQKVVPVNVLNAPVEYVKRFMEGYYAADGDKDIRGYYRFDNKGSIGAAGLLYLAFRMGYSTSINTRTDKPQIYRVTCTKMPQRKCATAIKKIENFGPTTEHVYDLETDNHHFAAGVGKLVVHNTDSVFSMFSVDHLPPSQPHRVAYCTVVAAYVASQVTVFLRSNNKFKPFDKQWMELQYEKTYRFWLLFSKKRYAGEMTEFDPYHFTDDQKGVASKRRDFCNYVKEIYGKILKSLFDPQPDITRDQRIENALAVVRRAIEDLLNNQIPFDKLVISKLLKDHYKVLKHKQCKGSKLCDFTADNIYVDDLIIFQCASATKEKFAGATCEAIITEKHMSTMFSASKENRVYPLTVKIVSSTPIVMGQPIPDQFLSGQIMHINYGDIMEKSASVITLDKIMNPKTSEKALEPIKHPHVRLARRMFLRDPATAPKSGARVPYVFCESKKKVLQYLRAEDPTFAKTNNLVVDPEYYLKKQCENAWAQILDTACPGISTKIFAEAYSEYQKKSMKQPDIKSFIAGTHLSQMQSIELSKNTTKVAVKATQTTAVTKPISAFFISQPRAPKEPKEPTEPTVAPKELMKAQPKAAPKGPKKGPTSVTFKKAPKKVEK